MQIWIEHEVWVLDQQKSLQKAMWTLRPSDHYNEYKEIMPGLSVAYDKEYYNTQYEVKFRWFDPSVVNIAGVSDYFGMLYWKHDTIQNKWPDFVWTHIHLFNSYSPTSKGHIQITERVFREMASFWKKFYEDDRIAHIYKSYELKRLSTSNNLLKFLDHNIFLNKLKSILEYNCQSYQYKGIGYDRPKYAPVIWSHARWGKEYSLELRYISNTYFLLEDPAVIKQLVDDCQNIVENVTTVPVEDLQDTKNTIESIFKSYLTITTLSYGIQNNLSLRDVEERIRKSLPITTSEFNQDRLRFISQVNLNLIPDNDIFSRSNDLVRGRWEESSDDWYSDEEWEPDDEDGEEEST